MLVGAAGLLMLTACSSPTPTATRTVTASASAAAGSAVSSTAVPSAAASQAATSPAPSTSSSSVSSAGTGDANRPVGQCSDASLRVTVRGYGTSSGHVISQIVFTNTGSRSCQLRGYPGVSLVGHGNGTQIGAAAARENQTVATVSLAPGSSNVNAILQAVNIGSNGGPLGSECPTTSADGYRIYPPHSTKAVFVRASGLRACTSSTAWMTIAPVTDDPK